jgi:hypothetical protein
MRFLALRPAEVIPPEISGLGFKPNNRLVKKEEGVDEDF